MLFAPPNYGPHFESEGPGAPPFFGANPPQTPALPQEDSSENFVFQKVRRLQSTALGQFKTGIVMGGLRVGAAIALLQNSFSESFIKFPAPPPVSAGGAGN